MSAATIPLTPALIGAIEAAGFVRSRTFTAAASLNLPLDASVLPALAEAGLLPPAIDGRRRQVVLIEDRVFIQVEMRDVELQEWLLLQRAAADLLTEACASGNESRLFATAQTANAQLVARALGVSEDDAWALPLSARRNVVKRQDALNSTRLYAELKEGADHAKQA